MKRLITPPPESNEATHQPAPLDNERSAAEIADQEEGVTVQQQAARGERRQRIAQLLKGVTVSDEDMQWLREQDPHAAEIAAQKIAAGNEALDAPAKVSREPLPTRKELRAKERAGSTATKPLGKRALDAAAGVVKVARDEVDAFQHRGMQRVRTDYGDVWVRIRKTRPTHIVSK